MAMYEVYGTLPTWMSVKVEADSEEEALKIAENLHTVEWGEVSTDETVIVEYAVKEGTDPSTTN